jgi:hypothetical protein
MTYSRALRMVCSIFLFLSFFKAVPKRDVIRPESISFSFSECDNASSLSLRYSFCRSVLAANF